jgi:hypothetical protein
MSRKLEVERTYSLGQYQNIKLFDSIEIPDGFEYNTELVNNMRKIQMAQLELDFKKYLVFSQKLAPYSPEDAIPVIEEVKVNTLDAIKNIVSGGKTNE